MTRKWRARIFVIPVLVLILGITIFPLIYSLGISLTYYYLPAGISPVFVGVENYITAFQDPEFWNSLKITFKIAIPALFLEFFIGFALALLLNGIKKGRTVIASFLTTPVMIAPAAAAMAFRLLYHPEYGPINAFLSVLSNKPVKIDWLGSPNISFFSILLVDVWQMTPFIMLILLAGLSSIPEELYESARIDGSSSFQIFKYITLPLLKLPIIVAILIRVIDLLKFFDLVYVLTMGGPARTTETITFFTYFAGLRFFRVGYGAALSFILLFIVVGLTSLFLKVTKLKEIA
ncbi:sugar ABC transporter permease [Candidatus Aerophobetes bacterium]|nr:sugar ABC transporter permease [Candidatus Aerophobetes bacterium]